MRAKTIEQIGVFALLGFALLALCSELRVEAQTVVAARKQATLGSVWIGDHEVSVMIAYQTDSALIAAAIPENEGKPRYIPLMGLTYRGVPSLQLDVLSSSSNDVMWIRMSGAQNELLAHYRFGDETALTRFGRIKLLKTLFPKHLGGGPVPFPKEGADTPLLRARFYHYDGM